MCKQTYLGPPSLALDKIKLRLPEERIQTVGGTVSYTLRHVRIRNIRRSNGFDMLPNLRSTKVPDRGAGCYPSKINGCQKVQRYAFAISQAEIFVKLSIGNRRPATLKDLAVVKDDYQALSCGRVAVHRENGF